jgi:hypothetical protein
MTLHDKLLASLVAVASSIKDGVSRLLSRGAAKWSGRRPSPVPPVVLAPRGKRVSDIVQVDRGEG